jgi:hypothetical protein
MPLALAIAITRLLSQNVRNLFGDGISFADIRDLELSRIQRLRKGHGVFCLREVDGDLVQIGPNCGKKGQAAKTNAGRKQGGNRFRSGVSLDVCGRGLRGLPGFIIPLVVGDFRQPNVPPVCVNHPRAESSHVACTHGSIQNYAVST